MKWIAVGLMAGWTGIVALAWYLADRRIWLCTNDVWPDKQSPCFTRATATRDAVLIWGPAVGLALLVGIALLWQRERLKRIEANPAARPIPAARPEPERLR